MFGWALEEEERRQKLLWCYYVRRRSMLRVRNVISSASLPRDARDSVWYRIYQERDNSTFISTTSLDADAFDFLLLNFSKYYVVKSGRGKGGRPPRLVHKHAVLACLLHFYSSTVELKTLSEVFAVVPSTLSVILRKAELALEKALGTIDDARICFPSKETQSVGRALQTRKNHQSKEFLDSPMERTSEFRSRQRLICKMRCTMV